MTIQSSFLIRCTLSPASGPQARGYDIEHVQTGARMTTSDLAEVNAWLVDINGRYLGEALQRVADVDEAGAPDGDLETTGGNGEAGAL